MSDHNVSSQEIAGLLRSFCSTSFLPLSPGKRDQCVDEQET